MKIRTVLGVPACVSATVVAPASAASPAHPGHPGPRECARQFDRALHVYLDTTARHDATGFERLMSKDYTVILPGGRVYAGKEQGSVFIDRFFARTDWTQTFDETSRAVEGCRTALAVYDSTYSDTDGSTPLVIALTWTYRHGHWLVLTDQNTTVDPA